MELQELVSVSVDGRNENLPREMTGHELLARFREPKKNLVKTSAYDGNIETIHDNNNLIRLENNDSLENIAEYGGGL